MSTLPFAFHDISAGDFPMIICWFDVETGKELVHERMIVDEPGALRIPGHDRPTAVEITFGTGRVIRMEPS